MTEYVKRRKWDGFLMCMSCHFDEESDDPPLPDDPFWEGDFERLFPSSTIVRNKDVVLRPRWKGFWHTIAEKPWHNRGWILQKRVLSRRIIYYTNRKIFWECKKLSSDEENRPNLVPSLRSQYTSQLDELEA
ncbi:hypothetical protein K469DRAFT_689549 [Zopfia rhizophila CBS 207.26]|uniref:Heterokaryon incompatibility domain-containing protein n=1 Tax=Zopfia rhizophila CBS 207.26 TaxID=1314779 RepID=A0A6A6DW31_9PEZI|nr:hypothetical protein K469DRAFT_689549 [Zopfia rhizophila CBS 207.26]